MHVCTWKLKVRGAILVPTILENNLNIQAFLEGFILFKAVKNILYVFVSHLLQYGCVELTVLRFMHSPRNMCLYSYVLSTR